MPILDTPLDDIQKDIFDSIKNNLIEIMSDLGLAVLIIWLLRKKNGNIEINGDGNIVGNNNQLSFIKTINNVTVIIGTPPAEKEAIPILVIYQPENEIKFFPLSNNYRNLDTPSLENAIKNLDKEKQIERINAMSVIKDSGNRKYIQKIVPRILDSDPIIQVMAADAAAEQNCVEAIPTLIEALAQKEIPFHVKEALAFSLIEIGGKDAILPLMKFFREDRASPVYLNLPITLACLSNDSIYEEIINQANNGSKENKIYAIRLLEELFSAPQINLAS